MGGVGGTFFEERGGGRRLKGEIAFALSPFSFIAGQDRNSPPKKRIFKEAKRKAFHDFSLRRPWFHFSFSQKILFIDSVGWMGSRTRLGFLSVVCGREAPCPWLAATRDGGEQMESPFFFFFFCLCIHFLSTVDLGWGRRREGLCPLSLFHGRAPSIPLKTRLFHLTPFKRSKMQKC